jgi:NADH-quinone oxidoreductase subunit B
MKCNGKGELYKSGSSGRVFFTRSFCHDVRQGRWPGTEEFHLAVAVCDFLLRDRIYGHHGRFGAERLSFSPRQADLLMVMGTIAKKMAPVVQQVYVQMAEPRWVIAVGACAASGGIFDTYSVLQGIDRIVPVDVYVPGCPPRPEQIIDGFIKVQELVGKESLRRRYSQEYKDLLASYGI